MYRVIVNDILRLLWKVIVKFSRTQISQRHKLQACRINYVFDSRIFLGVVMLVRPSVFRIEMSLLLAETSLVVGPFSDNIPQMGLILRARDLSQDRRTHIMLMIEPNEWIPLLFQYLFHIFIFVLRLIHHRNRPI